MLTQNNEQLYALRLLHKSGRAFGAGRKVTQILAEALRERLGSGEDEKIGDGQDAIDAFCDEMRILRMSADELAGAILRAEVSDRILSDSDVEAAIRGTYRFIQRHVGE